MTDKAYCDVTIQPDLSSIFDFFAEISIKHIDSTTNVEGEWSGDCFVGDSLVFYYRLRENTFLNKIIKITKDSKRIILLPTYDEEKDLHRIACKLDEDVIVLEIDCGGTIFLSKYIKTQESLDLVNLYYVDSKGENIPVEDSFEYKCGEPVTIGTSDTKGLFFDEWELIDSDGNITDVSSNEGFLYSFTPILPMTFRARYSNEPIYSYVRIIQGIHHASQATMLKYIVEKNLNQPDVKNVYPLTGRIYIREMVKRYGGYIEDFSQIKNNPDTLSAWIMSSENWNKDNVYVNVISDEAFVKILKHNKLTISAKDNALRPIVNKFMIDISTYFPQKLEEGERINRWFTRVDSKAPVGDVLNLHLYAKDVAYNVSTKEYKPIKVTLEMNDKTQGNIGGSNVKSNANSFYFHAQAIAEPGYVFDGWYYFDSSLNEYKKTDFGALGDYKVENVEFEEIDLVAKFKETSYFISSWETSSENKLMEWRSKRLQSEQPFNLSSAQVYADDYPVNLSVDMFSSPVKNDESKQHCEINVTTQNARRLPPMRPEKFLEIEIKSKNDVTDVKVSTSMGGLLNGNM